MMFRLAWSGILILWMAFAIPGASAIATNEVLTSAAAILSLTANQAARGIPVSVTGVVTLAEADWGGRFFVQDSTSGLFVNSTKHPPPSPGDFLQVGGVTDPGSYSPVITSPNWKKLGTAPLPEARPVSTERFISGTEDGQRVEVSGEVKSVRAGKIRTALEVESGGYRFTAFAPIPLNANLNLLVGAKVHVRGTAAVAIEARQRGSPVVNIFAPQAADLIVDQPPARLVTREALGTAAELLALTADQADQRIPLSITGIVTVAEPQWGGDFFVQDATGGVFVRNKNHPPPKLGELVEVSGASHSSRYAPVVVESHWKKVGTAPLPDAKPVSVERLMSGAEEGRRVEVSGVVRSAHASQTAKSKLAVDLASGGSRFRAFLPLSSIADPNSLLGATIRVRGTASASFDQTLRRLLTVEIFVPRESDLIVDRLPGPANSEEPITPLNNIARYHQNGSSETRIRVRGVVAYQRPGEDLFLRDESGPLQVKCTETNVLVPGEIVEAIGFAGSERFLPVLKDAAVVHTRKTEKPVVPQKISIHELLEGSHHSDLISLQGKLLDCSLRPLRFAHSLSNAPAENILTLQSGTYFFTAKAAANQQFAKLTSIPIGSTLEVSGICILQPDEQGKMANAQVLLPDVSSIRILKRPGWWTPRRLLIGLGSLLGVSLVGAIWTLMIFQKNAVLKLSVAEKIKAQDELQRAHDLLESRVEERTKELKFEMDARKEAEVRFGAVLSERRRLAQELHDTLLQGFTGVGLKLDALFNTLPPSLASTKEQLQNVLDQSDEYLVEARRAVWELRSPSLEQPGDLADALRRVSERALHGTNIRLNFSSGGSARDSEPSIENNLLRICEEAVTNAAKHARPTQVEVNLQCLPVELRLQIRDNGCGFDPQSPALIKDGHFGLVGIRERVKSIGGNCCLKSQPGQGTEILVTVPLAADFPGVQ